MRLVERTIEYRGYKAEVKKGYTAKGPVVNYIITDKNNILREEYSIPSRRKTVVKTPNGKNYVEITYYNHSMRDKTIKLLIDYIAAEDNRKNLIF